jgi:hypothetical protein
MLLTSGGALNTRVEATLTVNIAYGLLSWMRYRTKRVYHPGGIESRRHVGSNDNEVHISDIVRLSS